VVYPRPCLCAGALLWSPVRIDSVFGQKLDQHCKREVQDAARAVRLSLSGSTSCVSYAYPCSPKTVSPSESCKPSLTTPTAAFTLQWHTYHYEPSARLTAKRMDEALGRTPTVASYCSLRYRTTVRICSPPRTCWIRSTVISLGSHSPTRSSRRVAARSSAKIPWARKLHR
jgi:hypothetical protein